LAELAGAAGENQVVLMSIVGVHEEEARVRKRDRASIATGAGLGASLGAFAAVLGLPAVMLWAGIGAAVGAVVGRLVASRISPEEWDPPANDHPYVGTNSPDDDIASA
jgi:hypothetical protein